MEMLQRLSENPYGWFVLDFVEKKHFGILIGKGGAKLKQLKEYLGIDINIDQRKEIFKINGTRNKKEFAIKHIK